MKRELRTRRGALKNPVCMHTIVQALLPPDTPSMTSQSQCSKNSGDHGTRYGPSLSKVLISSLKQRNYFFGTLNRKEKHKSMFKCPQNGILGSVESSQTCLVKNLSFLQQP